LDLNASLWIVIHSESPTSHLANTQWTEVPFPQTGQSWPLQSFIYFTPYHLSKSVFTFIDKCILIDEVLQEGRIYAYVCICVYTHTSVCVPIMKKKSIYWGINEGNWDAFCFSTWLPWATLLKVDVISLFVDECF
jgi:hypothetical protein